jgi:hypothetical protein
MVPPRPPPAIARTAAFTTGQVDVNDVLPGLLIKFENRREADDAGVGYDDVEVAELLNCLPGGRRK